MASSDDDVETFPEVVSDYYFYGAEDEPVSFAELPIQWGNGERLVDKRTQIYLRGTTDNGLQRLHKQVKAWKYELLREKPEISVLSKDNNWIKLKKPRRSFENEIRTILISLHCLHFFKRKPKASSSALWDHLYKVFSLYDIRPSVNDLMDHLNFIRKAVKRDKRLGKSKFLASLLDGRPRKRRDFNENMKAVMKPSFIVDDTIVEYDDDQLTTKCAEDNDGDDQDDIFDNICAICDNGGDLTCCEGKCLRSFHATRESAKSDCESLGLTTKEVKGSRRFICLNCSYEQHQCFVCGKLGSSNESFGAEVFCCGSPTCGHFYHPQCVAKLLKDKSDIEAHDLEERITAGEPFICPAHKCHKCKHGENDKVKDLQFAVCRRCPRSYHRKCLPSKIVFHKKYNDEEVIPRAWNGLLHKSRALIFCLKHEMDHVLRTPIRTIKFPTIDGSKRKAAASEKTVNVDHKSDEKYSPKSQTRVEKSSSFIRPIGSSRKRVNTSCEPEVVKKNRLNETYKKSVKKRPNLEKPSSYEEDHKSVDEEKQTPLDANSWERLPALVKEADSAIKLDTAKVNHVEKLPFIPTNLSEAAKSGFIKANCLAMRKLEEGCNIKDALVGYDSAPRDNVDIRVAYRRSNDASYASPEYSRSRRLDNINFNGYKRENDHYGVSHGFDRQAYIEKLKKYGIKSSLCQMTGYTRGHQDQGFSNGYALADQSLYNSYNTAMQRYGPRLDELNHTRMNNKSMGHHDQPLGLRTHTFDYAPGPCHYSSCGWVDE